MRNPCIALAALSAATFFLAGASAGAQTEIRSLTGIIEGHEVGGLAVDWVGVVYAADFGDIVWRVTPEGERRELISGLYGTSGNAIDAQGNLLQSSFYADTVSRIDRRGQSQPFATRGLDRPVGIAVHKQTSDVYVANCASNSIARIVADGTAGPFAQSKLFNCPYGLTFDRAENLYTVNFHDNRMLKIDPQGAVTLFATVSEKGLGHVCFKADRFYVTAFWSHGIYEVTLGGGVRRILGNGEPGLVDGTAADARLSFPMGIACHPWAPRLYVNEDVNESRLPRRSTIRVVNLDTSK
jgi:DNA-binding beta-propeller fold protein YncE